MVVVLIETTELLGFLGALQLSTDKAELRTVVGFNTQAHVLVSGTSYDERRVG
jgi:hypothetical protein